MTSMSNRRHDDPDEPDLYYAAYIDREGQPQGRVASGARIRGWRRRHDERLVELPHDPPPGWAEPDR